MFPGSKQRIFAFLMFAAIVSPGPSASAETYLTKDEALTLILGTDAEIAYDPMPLDDEALAALRKSGLGAGENRKAHFFVGRKNGAASGYALIDSEIGKHLPITYIVGISPAGDVTQVEMMVFREVRGWEAREQRFVKQFRGKNLANNLELGPEIRHVTGATLSSRAIAVGVKRALVLWNYFYGRN